MSYLTLKDKESVQSGMLVVIKPKYLLSGLVFSGSGPYYRSFALGYVTKVWFGSAEKTLATSSACSDGDWFYDKTNQILYIDSASSPEAWATKVVCEYELYLATYDAHFSRVPTDDSTDVVYWEPLISKSPTITTACDDFLFGVLPTSSTSVTINNTTHWIEDKLRGVDSRTNLYKAPVDVYHWLDSLSEANVKLVMRGICGDISYDTDSTTIRILDHNAIFEDEYRHTTATNFYTSSIFPDVDPDYDGRPIRRVIGVVDGVIGVNIDYKEDNPGSTDNRNWVFSSGAKSDVVHNIVDDATFVFPDKMRIYLDSVDGLSVGDTVRSFDPTNSFQGHTILAINPTASPKYIDVLETPYYPLDGGTVTRLRVANVTVLHGGTLYFGQANSAFANYEDVTNDVYGITFTGNAETLMGFPSGEYIQSSDLVFARVYGEQNAETIGGSPFGSDSTLTKSLTSLPVILYSILKNNLGIPESEIDTSAFTSLEAAMTDQIGFTVPFGDINDFPSYKDLVTLILGTGLIKLFRNIDGKWTIATTGVMGAYDHVIDSESIIDGSFSVDHGHSDILSDVVIEYSRRDVSGKGVVAESYSRAYKSNSLVKSFYGISKQKTFKSLHFISSEAGDLADKISSYFSERSGIIKLKTTRTYINAEIGDVFKISRKALPGKTYTGSEGYIYCVLTSIQRGLRGLDLELTDQLGIENNAGVW